MAGQPDCSSRDCRDSREPRSDKQRPFSSSDPFFAFLMRRDAGRVREWCGADGDEGGTREDLASDLLQWFHVASSGIYCTRKGRIRSIPFEHLGLQILIIIIVILFSIMIRIITMILFCVFRESMGAIITPLLHQIISGEFMSVISRRTLHLVVLSFSNTITPPSTPKYSQRINWRNKFHLGCTRRFLGN